MEDWIGIARMCGFATEADMLHYFYKVEGLSLKEIGTKLGVGPATLSHRLDKCKIEKRSRGGANNSQRIGKILHRMDQRELFMTKDVELAKRLGAHPSTVYKYKREVRGGHKPWNSVQLPQPQVSSDGEQHSAEDISS